MSEIAQFTTEELEAMLASRRKAEKADKERKRKEYEATREARVTTLTERAVLLSGQIRAFYEVAFEALIAQREELQIYGKLRANSKGGFSVIAKDGAYKIDFKYQSLSDWDERASKAEELLKDFLSDTVKKKDQTLHDIIVSLLARNNAGNLEFSRIQELYKYEDRYEDPRWVEAIRLLKESYQKKGSKYYINFWVRDEKGTYQPINLNFNTFSHDLQTTVSEAGEPDA